MHKCTFNNETVDHITNIDLKSLCIRNLNETVVAYLNINSSRNNFDLLALQVKANMDIQMISETKLMKVFLPANFCWMITFPFPF